jgi:hypothetical protein
MNIKKIIFTFIIINQSTLSMENHNKEYELGIFALSIRKISKNNFSENYFKNIIEPLYPSLIINKGDSKTRQTLDSSIYQSYANSVDLTGIENKETNLIITPTGDNHAGLSGGIGFFLSQLHIKKLPLHTPEIENVNLKNAIFTTGTINLKDQTVGEIGSLFTKLQGLSDYLKKMNELKNELNNENNSNIELNSILIIPKDNEIEFNTIFKFNSIFDFKLPKVHFSQNINELTKISENFLNSVDKKNKSNFYFDAFFEHNYKFNKENYLDNLKNYMIIIAKEFLTVQNETKYTDKEKINLVNIFLEQLKTNCNEFNKENLEIIYKCFFHILSKLSLINKDFFEQLINIIQELIFDAKISPENKENLLNLLGRETEEIISAENNNIKSLIILYDSLEKIQKSLSTLKGKYNKKLQDILNNIVKQIENSNLLTNINRIKNLIAEIEKIKTNQTKYIYSIDQIIKDPDLEKLFTFNNNSINAIDINDINPQVSIYYENLKKEIEENNNKDFDLYLDTAFNSLFQKLELIYKDNYLFQLLNKSYGINSFESNGLTSKEFFDKLTSELAFFKNDLLIFYYFHISIEKSLFNLDNPEFICEWKKFINTWIKMISWYQPIELLLFHYTIYQYNKINLTDSKAETKKSFYANTLASLLFFNRFNEDLLFYIITILNNLKDNYFLKTINNHFPKIENNFIKQYIINIMIKRINNNNATIEDYKAFANMFFLYPEDQQNLFLKQLKQEEGLHYLALIQYIFNNNKNNSALTSLFTNVSIECGWVIDSNKLEINQKILLNLLKKLITTENLVINWNNIKKALFPNCYPSYDSSSIYVAAIKYTPYLILLIKKIKQDDLENVNLLYLIFDKLLEKIKHYLIQIKDAKKCNNQHTKFYKICLGNILTELKPELTKLLNLKIPQIINLYNFLNEEDNENNIIYKECVETYSLYNEEIEKEEKK